MVVHSRIGRLALGSCIDRYSDNQCGIAAIAELLSGQPNADEGACVNVEVHCHDQCTAYVIAELMGIESTEGTRNERVTPSISGVDYPRFLLPVLIDEAAVRPAGAQAAFSVPGAGVGTGIPDEQKGVGLPGHDGFVEE